MKTIYKSTTVNHETGEVKESTTVRVVKGEEPSYIKLYLQDISYLYGLPATAGGDGQHQQPCAVRQRQPQGGRARRVPEGEAS